MILLETTGRAFLLANVTWDLRLTSLTLIGALLGAAIVIALTSRWRKRSNSAGPTASDQLAMYRSLYLEGAISKEEFERLRAHLGGELRRTLDVPASTNTQTEPKSPSSTPSTEPKQAAPEPPANGVQPS